MKHSGTRYSDCYALRKITLQYVSNTSVIFGQIDVSISGSFTHFVIPSQATMARYWR